MDSNEASDEDGEYVPPPYSPDLHLKTAIRPHMRNYLVNRIRKGPEYRVPLGVRLTYEHLMLTRLDLSGSLRVDSERLYGILLTPQTTPHYDTRPANAQVTSNYKLAKEFMSHAANYLIKDIADDEQAANLSSRIDSLILTDTIKNWLFYRDYWEVVRDCMKEKQISRNHILTKHRIGCHSYDVYTNCDFLIMRDNRENWLLDYQQVLMIFDTINSRFLGLLHASITRQLELEFLPSEDVMLALYKAGDDLVSALGNKAYDTLKLLEPLCIGVYLTRTETLAISRGFLPSIIESAPADEYSSLFISRIKDLLESLPLDNHLFEVFGLFRHFGHPTVDEVGGVQHLLSHAREDIQVDPVQLDKVTGAFIKMFVLEFIGQNKVWPPCSEREEGKYPVISKLLSEKPITFSEFALDIPLVEWSNVKLHQVFEFDDYEDFTELILDKALSPYREHWHHTLNRDVVNFRIEKNHPEYRRVLLQVLSMRELSCKKIREAIQSGEIPLSWLVIAYHAKEREMKILARLFAMMCLEIRLYFSMTEKNVSEKLYKYIPYQTTTWSDSELTKVMLNLSSLNTAANRSHRNLKGKSLKKSKQCDTVFVNISLDFNKFNLRWRKESTDPIFSEIDNLFNTPGLYTYSHRFFETAFYYLSSGLCPPDILNANKNPKNPKQVLKDLWFESETTWIGQFGGQEGIRQKCWTIVIISALYAAQQELGIPGTIIGQGDNQVIVAAFTVPIAGMSAEEYIRDHIDDLNKRIEDYLSHLKLITGGIGMDLKLEESWVSTHLLNYGKEIICDGSYCSASLKKISRAYQETSEINPTLQNRVASIFSSAQGACLKGFDTLSPYIISVFESLNMLVKETSVGTMMGRELRNLLIQHNRTLDANLKLSFLLIPRECGGFPIQPYPTFLFRGHPDNLTMILPWIKFLGEKYPQARKLLDLIMSKELYSKSRDLTQLIQDPQSVNFKRPIQASNKIKQILSARVKSITKNVVLNSLMKTFDNKSLLRLVDFLSSITPCNPRVLNEIFRNSPDGVLLSILGKFYDMRTIKQVLPNKDANYLIQNIKESDHSTFLFLIIIDDELNRSTCLSELGKKVDDPREWLDRRQECSYKSANILREESWGKPIEGVTTPHPCEQTKLFPASGDCCSYELCKTSGFILYTFQQTENGHSLLFKRGPVVPYIGSGTSEKRSGPLLNYSKTERGIRSAQQILRITQWLVDPREGNQVPSLLSNIIKSRTDADETFLTYISGRHYGGSVLHRFSDVTSKHECRPGLRVNMFDKILFSSDSAAEFSRGKENYPILFQACFLYGLTLLHHLALYNPSFVSVGNRTYHQHFVCSGCTPLLEEKLLYSDQTPPTISTLSNCPIVFSKVDQSLVNIPISDLSSLQLTEPDINSPLFLNQSLDAAASVIISDLKSQTSVIVQGDLRTYHRVSSLTCLTVGYFSSIPIKRLFQHIAKIWILDNIHQVIRIAETRHLTFLDACAIVMSLIPDYSWNILKPFLCLPEIRDRVWPYMRQHSSGTEIFISGEGLGYACTQLALESFESLRLKSRPLDRRWFRVYLSTNAPGLSMQRAINIWVASLVITSNWTTYRDLSAMIRSSRQITQNSVTDGQLSLRRIIIGLSNIGPKLPPNNVLNKYRLCLSKVGVEPWLAPALMKDQVLPEVPNPILNWVGHGSVLSCAAKRIFKQIGLHQVIRLPHIHLSRTSTDPNVQERIPTVKRKHTRSDHKYRLASNFSTGYLKYANIICAEGLTQFRGSMHLAEGAGSVARMAAILFGSRVLIYNSLIDTSRTIYHRSYNFKPAELLDLGPEILVEGPTACFRTGGDITNLRTISEFSELAEKHKRVIDLVTCDAELSRDLPFSSGINLLTSFLEITTSVKVGALLIFKTYSLNSSLFEAQVAIWASHVRLARVITPMFSSHESHEVFLVGRKAHLAVSPSRVIITPETQSLLRNLNDFRLRKNPFLQNTKKDTLKDLFLFLDKIGFRLNIEESIAIFLNHIISTHEIRNLPHWGIRVAQNRAHESIRARLSLIGALTRLTRPSLPSQLSLGLSRSDSSFIQRNMETLINAFLLTQIVTREKITNNELLAEWHWIHKNKCYYSVKLHLDTWRDYYGKSLFRIIGYLSILEDRSLELPSVLVNTTR